MNVLIPQPHVADDMEAERLWQAPRDWLELASMPDGAIRMPSGAACIRVVCETINVSEVDIVSYRRDPRSCRARQIAYYLMRVHTPMSLPMIGRRVGGREHTCILYGIKRVEQRMQADVGFRALVNHLSDLVQRTVIQ